MRSFLKFFFAALLALFIFTALGFLILVGVAGMFAGSEKTPVASKSVLYIDLSTGFSDRKSDNTFAQLTGDNDAASLPLYDVVRLIEHAASDSAIRGIYIKSNDNANGFAASEELRNALLGFKKSNKFIIAYGDVISQKAYYVANVADKIYCNPKGSLDWKGFASQLFFIKNTLKELQVEPQIFYAGKFKSATEPLREEKMTDANRLQTSVWLGDLYTNFLLSAAETRKLDTAQLHTYANSLAVQTASDAVKYNLIDGTRYDDEVKEELRSRLGIGKDDKINFVQLGSYADAVSLSKYNKDKIAIVYAEGDIVYGKGEQGQVGSDEFRTLFAKLRTDKSIKGVVLRINSPGGSALASEIIWREGELIKKSGKPLVVSMGDVAASGGYYIAAPADSIFAQPNTITGSIGVFGIIPNLQSFFKNKLGITFDEVKTADNASFGSVARPLTDMEKIIVQREIDTIYHDFKTRVSDGRRKDMEYVDSIAQGRVWTGERALEIGLVDQLGGLNDAIACAARIAKITDYSLREYPQPKTLLDMLKSSYGKNVKTKAIKEELGNEGFMLFEQIKRAKSMVGTVQARLPYDIIVE
ncbi:MAG: signal peptide peptidase SppA [Chitinophagaceae bacterium]|nr:signal peptide peptidase SppA [Chitinophagaceae bacterium]